MSNTQILPYADMMLSGKLYSFDRFGQIIILITFYEVQLFMLIITALRFGNQIFRVMFYCTLDICNGIRSNNNRSTYAHMLSSR